MTELHNERIEYKILLSGIEPKILEEYVHSIPYAFKCSYDDRFVNSIYYDTLNFKALHDNLSGVSRRYKTRLRWYNSINEANDCYIEFKYKNGVLGSKYIVPIDLNLGLNNISHSEIVFEVSKQLNDNDNLIFNYCSHNPVVLVRYHRSYYESKSYDIRITIDKGIRFYPQQFSRKLNITNNSRNNENIILEIKYMNSNHELISDIVQYLPYRVTKSSKYVMGVDSIMI